MKLAISKLRQIGLSEYEARAYVALLKENPASPYEIAKNSGIPTSKIYEVIRRLEQRQMVQSIQGERSRMFIPVSPDELVQSFKTVIEDNLQAIKNELKNIKITIDTTYTWHIKDYESLILRAKRMIETTRNSLLLSIWSTEFEVLTDSLGGAQARGVRIAIVHYGVTNIKFGQTYYHSIEDTIYAQKGVRGFILISDSKEVLTGKIEGKETEAIWSMNQALVMMAEDYIRHDIYLWKIFRRLSPLLMEEFGSRCERLRDIHNE
jgi:sugar-specific transcriptional regulator TrmB